MPLKKSQKSLKRWTSQKWTTPSGKKSATRKGKQHARHGLHKGKKR